MSAGRPMRLAGPADMGSRMLITDPPLITPPNTPVITPTGKLHGKPFYINAAGDPSFGALTSVPPFIFRNVTSRTFPLRANMAVLRAFCDQYLNMDIPPSIVHYAPALPYVYLMVLNYGSMSGSSVEAQNLGWVAQREVTFTVLLQRWREENGSLVFKDWASVSPFIYVDDPTSLTNGREIYGWNKVLGKIDSAVPLWIKDPRAPLRQFDLSVVDFATTYAGEADGRQVLLQVDLDPPPSMLQFPPDPRNPWSPIWAIPNAISNTASFLSSALDTALALRLRGFEDHRSLDAMRAMGDRLGEKLKSALPGLLPSHGAAIDEMRIGDALAGLPTLFVEAVTLKQFRNPEDPSLACYQALVDSSMGVDRVNRAGLLGDINLLRGDSSGGYSVRIHQLDAQPIISTLGLQVDSWSEGDGDTRGAIATVKPVLPSWLDVDLYYGAGNLICSRAHGGVTSKAGHWLDEKTNMFVRTADAYTSRPYYNNALGAATQPITGPFHFPDVTLQVYPLQADPEKIEAVLKNYLNDSLSEMVSSEGAQQNGWRFEPFGSYVYMMVTVYGDEFGQMWSGTNNIGGFFEREVTFCIPVKWYDEKGELITVAVIEPFTFSNNDRAVATDREVNGYNTIKASIDSPRDMWLEPNGPAARRRLLELGIEVIPALNLGQKAQQRTLLEIDERDALAPDDEAGWRNVAAGWGHDAIGELKRKTYLSTAQADEVIAGKALALELLAFQAPLNRIILKQYRDGENLTRACYQALVHASSTITSVYDVQELSSNIHMRLHRQPGNLIGDALGLKVKCQESAGGEVVDVLQPVRPFWMRIGLKEDLATVACFRAQQGPWKIVHPWFESLAPSAEAQAAPAAGADEQPPRSQVSFDPPAQARRRLAGQKPYFKNQGPTRVGAWLANVPADVKPAAAAAAQGSDQTDWPAPPSYDTAPARAPTAGGAACSWLDVPARPTGDTLALFADAKDLEAWLDVRLDCEKTGANLHLDVRNSAQDWLRRSIVNELAWIRVCVEGCIETLRGVYAANPTISALLDCDIAPSSMMILTEQFTVPELAELRAMAVRLLRDSCNQGEMKDSHELTSFESDFRENLAMISQSFNTFFDVSTEGIRATGLAWSWDEFLGGMITRRILHDSLKHFELLQHESRHAFLMTLPKAAYPLLVSSGDFIRGPQYKVDTTFESYDVVPFAKIDSVRDNITRIGILADLLERGMLDWIKPDRWRRYSCSEAAQAIDALDDVQLVIENILSSEWENRGPHARFLNPKGGRLPDQGIILEPQLEGFVASQGLQSWIDPVTAQASPMWVVPIPGASDSIRRVPQGGPMPLTDLRPPPPEIAPRRAAPEPAGPPPTPPSTLEPAGDSPETAPGAST